MSIINIGITNQIRETIHRADALVLGAGAGLSASAGISYNDPKIFKEMYTPFLKKGYRTIWEGITDNWQLTENNATVYWGFWANHIHNIYYAMPLKETYKRLYELIRDKEYFIITTNGDGQFKKGLFDGNRVFAMQGSYGLFQCQRGCRDEVFENRAMIDRMLQGFDESTMEIREADVPRCPHCKELLVPNLRVDGYFVESPHMVNKDRYMDFIHEHMEGSLLFLELGVGYNTPAIIRFPFEQMTRQIKGAKLVRVNSGASEISLNLGNKAIATEMDIDGLINALLESR